MQQQLAVGKTRCQELRLCARTLLPRRTPWSAVSSEAENWQGTPKAACY